MKFAELLFWGLVALFWVYMIMVGLRIRNTNEKIKAQFLKLNKSLDLALEIGLIKMKISLKGKKDDSAKASQLNDNLAELEAESKRLLIDIQEGHAEINEDQANYWKIWNPQKKASDRRRVK